MKKYITIIDPNGATYGYGGPAVPISHRVLFENKVFYGFESIQKLFPSHQAMIDFLVAVVAQTPGASGGIRDLTWSLSDTSQPVWTHGPQGTWVEILTKSS